MRVTTEKEVVILVSVATSVSAPWTGGAGWCWGLTGLLGRKVTFPTGLAGLADVWAIGGASVIG